MFECVPLPTFRLACVVTVLWACVVSGDSGAVMDCNDAQKRCMQQMGCSIAIHNYMIYCSALINGEEAGRCSYHCRMALISLLSTEDHTGHNFMTCDCGDHHFCRESKTRLQACGLDDITEAVKDVYNPDIKLTCSLAEMICAADTSCFTALSYYEQHCRKLVKGSKCTARCNNSLSILYRQPKALKLRNCMCDGMEKYDCPALRYNIETLCFNKHYITPPPHLQSTPRVRHVPDHTRSHHNRNNPHDRGGQDKTSSGEDNRVDSQPHKGGGKSALTAQHNSAQSSQVTYTNVLALLAAILVIQ